MLSFSGFFAFCEEQTELLNELYAITYGNINLNTTLTLYFAERQKSLMRKVRMISDYQDFGALFNRNKNCACSMARVRAMVMVMVGVFTNDNLDWT